MQQSKTWLLSILIFSIAITSIHSTVIAGLSVVAFITWSLLIAQEWRSNKEIEQ
jgi:hypothetical protein